MTTRHSANAPSGHDARASWRSSRVPRGELGRLAGRRLGSRPPPGFFAIVGRAPQVADRGRVGVLLRRARVCGASGERIYIGVFVPDRSTRASRSATSSDDARGPGLAALTQGQTKESLHAPETGVVVEVLSPRSRRARPRLRPLMSKRRRFLPDDASANPDVERLRAVRPALARGAKTSSLRVLPRRRRFRSGFVCFYPEHKVSPGQIAPILTRFRLERTEGTSGSASAQNREHLSTLCDRPTTAVEGCRGRRSIASRAHFRHTGQARAHCAPAST